MTPTETIDQIKNQSNLAGEKAKKVIHYQQLLADSLITLEEYQDLLSDLVRIEQVNSAADDLDQMIAVNHAIEILIKTTNYIK